MLTATSLTNLPLIVQKLRISGLQALLEGAPVLHESKLLWHRAFEMVLDGTREGLNYPCRWRLRSETKIHIRTARPNRRAGKVKRSDRSREDVNRQRCE